MKHSTAEFAKIVSRSLISASSNSVPTRSWTPELEQTLHKLGCRDSLNPTLVARVIDPFLLNHHSLASGFFHWASQQPGFSHSSTSYQSLIKSLSISRQFNALDKLLKQIKAHKIILKPSIYGLLIYSQIVGKNTQKAFSIFSEVSPLISEIGPHICNSLIAGLSCNGSMSDAHKAFDEMILRGVGFSTLGFGVFIWRFCRNAELGMTLSLLDGVRRSGSCINGSIIALLVVHGLCLESRVEEAVHVLDELRNRDCKPDFMAYRIVAESLRLMGDVVGAEKVLKKKRKLGVAPRASDYRGFIFELISERLICEAKDLGEVIVRGNFPIEDDVLNALVGSVASVDPSCAYFFLEYMLGKDKVPTLLTLSNLSRSLCKYGKVDMLLNLFEVLSAKEYFVDAESYNVMVAFLCKAGRVKEAYSVLQEMKKKGLGPDVAAYNSLMEACCKEDLVRPAKRLWDEMFVNGCAGNLKTYNILIQKLSEIGQSKEANTIFCSMLEKGVTPDTTTYLSLLEGLCQDQEINTALEVFKKSVNQDVVFSQTLLSSFTIMLCKEGNSSVACNLLRDFSFGTQHSNSHVILLKYLGDSGEVSLAIEHIKWIGLNSPMMLHEICSELLASLSSSSKPDPVLQMIQVLQGNYPESQSKPVQDMFNHDYVASQNNLVN